MFLRKYSRINIFDLSKNDKSIHLMYFSSTFLAPPKPPQPRASQFLQRFSIFRNSGSKKDESKEDQKKREAEEAEERRYHNAI